jgi:translation initiation factor 1 (eIF-1/SUI1)
MSMSNDNDNDNEEIKQFEDNDENNETFDIKPNTNVQIQLDQEDQEDPEATSDSDPIAQIIRQNDNSHELDGDIHMFKKARSGKKCDTIIIGLIFATLEDNKNFLKKIKTKFGTGGCHKEMPELSKNSMVFVFTGDCREKIRKLLVADYGKDVKTIKIHG